MEPEETGVFRAKIFTPPSGLLVLRTEDATYKISAVKILEPVGEWKLCVDGFYDQKLHRIFVLVWKEKSGKLEPFEEEDVVFVEVRTASRRVLMANLRPSDFEYVFLSEEVDPAEAFVVTASYAGKKAVKVIATGGEERSEEVFVYL